MSASNAQAPSTALSRCDRGTPAGVERGLVRGSQPALFLAKALSDPCWRMPSDLGQEPAGDLDQRLPARDRGQLLQADRPTAGLHPALVVAIGGQREIGLVPVVAGHHLKSLSQLPARELRPRMPGSRLS